MPNAPFIHPTPDDAKVQQDYLDRQRQMTGLLLKEAKLTDVIGRSNHSLETTLVERTSRQKQFLGLIMDEKTKLHSILQNTVDTEGVEAVLAKRLANSIKDRISSFEELVKLEGELNDYDTEQAQRKTLEGNRWYSFISKTGRERFGMQNKELSMVKSIGDELSKYPYSLGLTAYLLGTVVMLLAHGYSLFKSFDEAAAKFRRELGFTRVEAKTIREQTERMAIDFMHVGLSVGDAYESFKALGAEAGSVFGISKGLATTTALLKVQLGVAEESSAGFLRNMAGISQTSMEAQENTLLFAAALAKSAGVPVTDVMKDVANLSGTALALMSKYPNEIVKTAVRARQLHTTLNDMAKSSNHILDFTTNIQEEMKASVLIGKSLNLQKARELAYAGKLAESTEEILNIADRIDFSHLDKFQMDAFADATGHSTDELLKMIVARRNWDALRKSGDKDVQSMLAEYDKLNNASQEQVDLSSEQLKVWLETKNNLSRTASISAHWNSILTKISSVILPYVDKLLEFVDDHMEIIVAAGAALVGLWTMNVIKISKIGKLLSSWGKALKTFSEARNWVWLGKISDWIVGIGVRTMTWGKRLERISGLFSRIGTRLSGLISKIPLLGRMLGGIAKLVGRWLIPLTFAYHIFTRIRDILNDKAFMKMNGSGLKFFGLSIIKAFGAILGALWDTFNDFTFGLAGLVVKGLASAGKYLYNIAKDWYNKIVDGIADLLGESPSVIGLKIVKGISSIGGMLVRVFQNMFGEVANWIMASPLFRIGSMILDSISSIGGSIFDSLIGPFKKGISWISEHVPGMSKLADKIIGTGNNIMGEPVETRATATYANVANITPNGVIMSPTETKETTKPVSVAETKEAGLMTDDQGDMIISLLKQLLDKDTNVTMDGQLLSSTLARQTAFRGGYGVNRIT